MTIQCYSREGVGTRMTDVSTKESSVALRTEQILMPLHNIIKKKKEVGRPKKKKCIKIKYYTVKIV